MQVSETHIGGQSIASNAGLAAFEVAVQQQERFEETLERVSEKQSEIVDDLERRVEETRERKAAERGGVDIVVRADEPTASGDDNTEKRGNTVNVDA